MAEPYFFGFMIYMQIAGQQDNRGGRYCCMYVGGGMEKGENK